MLFFGDGVVAALGPWITSENSPYPHRRAFESAEALDSLIGILRAGGIILAQWGKVRRYMFFIKTNKGNHYFFHQITPSSFKHSTMAFSTWVLLRYFVFVLATKTKS